MSLNGDVGGSAPAADTPVETEVETSAPSGSSPEVSSGGGGDTGSDYDWGAWAPDKEDYPETYKPAISAVSSHYEQQIAQLRAEQQRNEFFRTLWESSEQGTSANEIAALLEARDELSSLKEQYEALNSNSTAWTTEKAQLAEEMAALQSQLAEMESKWPEAEQALRSELNNEYRKMLETDVEAFFAKHEEDLANPKTLEAFSAFHEADVPEAHAIELAKMEQIDQDFAKALLAGGTPQNKVLSLTLQASRSRTPAVSPAVGLTQGAAPVSRSSSPPARSEQATAPPAGGPRRGRLSLTSAFLSNLNETR